jgi:GntR family transcriptional repressor for pyruvate dehydrogenase complex
MSSDPTDGAGTRTVFKAIGREPRLSDKVTEAILETIASNQLKPGDLLPTERQLGEQFGVSRTVIREAVRALRAKGMLEVKGTVRESMRHFVKGSELDYTKVDEVRRVLEVAAAGLAAERATPEDIARINETIEQMDNSCEDVEKTVQFDIAFHRALATSTHNELFLVLHDSMGEMLLEVRRRNLARGAERRRLVVEMHRRIRDAVAAHDPDAARAAMVDHLGAVQESWEQQAGT